MLRFRGDLSQVGKFFNDFEKKLQAEANKRGLKKELGEKSIHSLRIRVQGQGLGIGSKDGESFNPVKLDPLEEAYILQRDRMKMSGNLSPKARVRFSNATATGQMLDSMKSRIKSYGFDLEISGRRRDGSDNADIADYYEELRPFFDFTDGEDRILSANFRDLLRQRAVELAKRF